MQAEECAPMLPIHMRLDQIAQKISKTQYILDKNWIGKFSFGALYCMLWIVWVQDTQA